MSANPGAGIGVGGVAALELGTWVGSDPTLMGHLFSGKLTTTLTSHSIICKMEITVVPMSLGYYEEYRIPQASKDLCEQ